MGGGDDLTHPINENNSLRSEFSIHRIDTLTYDTMDFFWGARGGLFLRHGFLRERSMRQFQLDKIRAPG